MTRNKIEERLVHYFAGECTENEKHEMEDWIAADPARRTWVESQRRIWEAAGIRARDWYIEALWRRVAAETKSSFEKGRKAPLRPAAERRAPVRTSTRRQRKPSFRARTLGVAAAVVLVLASAMILSRVFHSQPYEPEAPAIRELVTERSQRALYQLQDGTYARLNVDSRLTMLTDFASGTRAVQLDGEAYFEVAGDPQRPFLVHTQNAVIEVLGTEFGVRAYPDDQHVQVVVAEGTVSLRTEGSPDDSGTVLTRSEAGRLGPDGRIHFDRNVDLAQYLGWRQGYLVFRDAAFPEVIRELERWYDLQIELDIPYREVDLLNVTFEDESLPEVLMVVALSLGLEYEREGRNVTFYRAQ